MSTVDTGYGMKGYGGFPEGQRTKCRTGRNVSEKRASGRGITGENAPDRNTVDREWSGRNTFTGRMTAVLAENVTDANEDSGTGRNFGPETASAKSATGITGAGAETASNAESTAAAGARSSQDMALEEYAHYIYGQISELERRNYSRGNSVFIYISEEGFRAMQNDPEYEAWVMQNIREAYYYAGHRGGHDGYHSAHFFGATKEEYRGQSWSFGCSKCDQERRQELKRRRKKQLQALLKKRQEQKLLEKQRREQMYLEKRRLEKSVYKKLLEKKETERERLEEIHREEALARREAASAFRMYMAILKYNGQ